MALSHAILVSLADCSCSGYDLAKRFDGSVGFFWHATHQQIYRELTKLAEKGLIAEIKTIQQEGRPPKKIYAVTELGRSHLCDWIASPTRVAPIKDELLVKLFAGDLVSITTIRSLLRKQQLQHQEQLRDYRAIEQEYFAEPETLPRRARLQYLTLLNGIQFETGWLAWCEEAIESLASL